VKITSAASLKLLFQGQQKFKRVFESAAEWRISALTLARGTPNSGEGPCFRLREQAWLRGARSICRLEFLRTCFQASKCRNF